MNNTNSDIALHIDMITQCFTNLKLSLCRHICTRCVVLCTCMLQTQLFVNWWCEVSTLFNKHDGRNGDLNVQSWIRSPAFFRLFIFLIRGIVVTVSVFYACFIYLNMTLYLYVLVWSSFVKIKIMLSWNLSECNGVYVCGDLCLHFL